jgi:hypothetical protein
MKFITPRFWMAAGFGFALLVVLIALLTHQGDFFFFINIGAPMLSRDVSWRQGYDGQFAYFIARDPMTAASQLDEPAYRFQRILYPLLARLLALGWADAVPMTLVVVNILAVAFGTGAFAELLNREGAPVWTPLLFFMWFGVGQSLLYDLNEIIALAFALWGLVSFFRERMIWAGVLFALGALAKDMTFLFAVPAIANLFFARRWRAATQLLLLSASPFVVWMFILKLWLDRWSFAVHATRFEIIPFGGFDGSDPVFPLVFALLIIPGIVCIWCAVRRLSQVYALATLFSFAFLVFLPAYSYPAHAVFRLNTPLVLMGALLFANIGCRWCLKLFAVVWSTTSVLTLLVAVRP